MAERTDASRNDMHIEAAQNLYCTPEAVRALCGPRPHPASEIDAGRVSREARELAHKAFAGTDPVAAARSERLLYVIHAASAFAPPLHPIASVIWSTLMHEKMRSLGLDRAGPELATHRDLVDALDEAFQRADREDNSFIDEIADRTDDLGLVIYTKNWFSSTHGFTTQLVSLIQRCHGKAHLYPLFKALLENLYEEFENEPHPQMRARWPQRLGIDYSPDSAIEDPQQTTEAFALQNVRTGLALLPDPTYAAGSFLSIEAVFSGICRRIYPVLKKRGIEDHAMQSFILHAEGDVEHTSELLTAIERSELTPRDRSAILRGALAQLNARHEMFEAKRGTLRRADQG
jgi:pyrroloquinoline quinone (PQQ) biosynthesis protein C